MITEREGLEEERKESVKCKLTLSSLFKSQGNILNYLIVKKRNLSEEELWCYTGKEVTF